MREIKFRAFYHGGGNPNFTPHMEFSYPFPALFWKNIENVVEAVELMQYTGMKDSNGKDIYEGDILEYRYSKLNMPKDKEFYIYKCEIAWSEEICGFEIEKSWGDDNLLNLEIEKMEVIGNIHENPELLNE